MWSGRPVGEGVAVAAPAVDGPAPGEPTPAGPGTVAPPGCAGEPHAAGPSARTDTASAASRRRGLMTGPTYRGRVLDRHSLTVPLRFSTGPSVPVGMRESTTTSRGNSCVSRYPPPQRQW